MDKARQALQEAAFAFAAFFLTGFGALAWGPQSIPDLNTAKAALGGLILGALGAAAKAVLWYFTGTPAATTQRLGEGGHLNLHGTIDAVADEVEKRIEDSIKKGRP